MNITERINQLSRKRVQDILEQFGFAVYDTESTDVLKEALLTNVQDGTIPRYTLSED